MGREYRVRVVQGKGCVVCGVVERNPGGEINGEKSMGCGGLSRWRVGIDWSKEGVKTSKCKTTLSLCLLSETTNEHTLATS